jgi:hypothetical protein
LMEVSVPSTAPCRHHPNHSVMSATRVWASCLPCSAAAQTVGTLQPCKAGNACHGLDVCQLSRSPHQRGMHSPWARLVHERSGSGASRPHTPLSSRPPCDWACASAVANHSKCGPRAAMRTGVHAILHGICSWHHKAHLIHRVQGERPPTGLFLGSSSMGNSSLPLSLVKNTCRRL